MTAHHIDTEALRRLADAATEGPWHWDPPSDDEWPSADESLRAGKDLVLHGWGYDASGISGSDEDRAFIAAARTAVPALLDALAAAEHRATRAEAQSAIRGRAVAISRQRAEAWQKQYEYDMDMESRRADEAEARVKAVEELCDRASRDAGTLERNLLGGHRLYPKEIRRALGG